MIDEIAATAGVKVAHVIGGTFGAAVSMAIIKGPWWYRLCLFAGGLLFAAYVTPLAVDLLNMDKAENAVAFLVGMFGMSLSAAIIRTVQEVNFEVLMTELRAWFGRK